MRTLMGFLALSVVGGGALSGCSDAVSSTETVPSIAPAPSVVATSSNSSPPIVGVWRTHAQFKEGSLSDLHDLEFMLSLNMGGTLTQSSNYDGTPPVPPAYGVWRQTGPRTFELKYAFYAPPKFVKSGRNSAWVPSGRGLYSEKLELSADGDSYTSHVVYDFVDPTGNPAPGGGEGTATGTRVGFDSTP